MNNHSAQVVSKDVAELYARVPAQGDALADLKARMREPHRYYHDETHLAVLWRRHREFCVAAGLSEPGLVGLIASAIAFHDCVYDVRSRDNEARSADVWMRASERIVPEADRYWVADTIRATADHLAWGPIEVFTDAPSGIDEIRERARVWVLDLDLTPLGEDEPEFVRNTALLRREASHLTDVEFDRGRLAFLRRIAQAPAVYRTPVLAARFEAQARANLARELGGS